VTTVVTAGLAVLDFVFGVETGPTRGRNVFAASLSDVGGGPAANAAVTVAALGGHARFVGRVGDDTIGVFSAPALAAFAETADPDRRIEPGRGADGRLECGHLGARGVLWLNDGVIEHTPAYTVTTVDTLGAGDVHHGAFALGVAENRPIEDVVKRPAAAAALRCARFGGRAGVPCTEEVDAFLGCRSADR
jgi:sugar/nucleoside kinase (ribokinase family)